MAIATYTFLSRHQQGAGKMDPICHIAEGSRDVSCGFSPIRSQQEGGKVGNNKQDRNNRRRLLFPPPSPSVYLYVSSSDHPWGGLCGDRDKVSQKDREKEE
ncbi:hypothetical protein TNCT_127001 [Trichonephila clavata]|uniref:Uncharacterized protein n=1 Tax=Trichonephila clavata TaxID=2740835 RepID=A0A8X6KC18_TRICU|nr:hypothetical protein TNCT_127001 [Trichonephila clavata]